jgi:hypothetical protein
MHLTRARRRLKMTEMKSGDKKESTKIRRLPYKGLLRFQIG